MDKIFVTVFLVVAGVISAVFAFNAIYPAVVQSGDAMTSMERRIDDRMKSQITIITAAKATNSVVVWVKNIGSIRVLAPESSDVFYGPQGNFARIPYGAAAGTPYWDYVSENGVDWGPTSTIEATIHLSSTPDPGTYYIKFVLTNGISDEYLVSW